MTDSELDDFFVNTLKSILEDIKDCADYSKDIHTPEYEEINDDYSNTISELTEIINNCKTIDDLAEMDEEIIDSVYEYIATYADNFIISAEEPQHSEDLINYSKIEELLDLFLDDESDNEEFDENN